VSTELLRSLEADIARLGLREGNFVIVHSSFKSLRLAGVTPKDVIGCLLNVLTPSGTLMMPAFSYSFAGIFEVPPFNPPTTPGRLNGILTETLRTYPGALRSAHPTYSVAAIGKHAETVTRNKENAEALGPGSSYHDALKLNARILMLGVGNEFNSMFHTAEALSGVPYNDIPFRECWGTTALVEEGGVVREEPLHGSWPGCSDGFGVADPYLRTLGIMKEANVASAHCRFMDAQPLVEAIVARLKREPAWLLCRNFLCEPCNRRKARLRERGLI
jgi:aminoglycoside 3-N-acetyltransferase